MKPPDESGIKEDFSGKGTEWIATGAAGGERCTDEPGLLPWILFVGFNHTKYGILL